MGGLAEFCGSMGSTAKSEELLSVSLTLCRLVVLVGEGAAAPSKSLAVGPYPT